MSLLTDEHLRSFRRDLECGTIPQVARSKVRSHLIGEHGATQVIDQLPAINEQLDRIEAEVLDDDPGPRPAA